MSGGGASTKTETTVPGYLKPYAEKGLKAASTAFDLTSNKPYTGQFFARPNKTQQMGAQSLLAAAPGLGQGAPKIRDYADAVLGGEYLRPESNPFVKGMAEAATRGATDNFNRSVLPQLRSSAISQGAYGGSREAIETAVRAGEVDKNIRDTYAGIYGDNYARERGFMQQAPGLYSEANKLALQPGMVQSAVGDTMFQWDDNLVKEGLMKFQESQDAPWRAAERLNALIRGYGGSSTTSSQQIPWWQQALQAGMGIGGLALAF